MVLLCLGHSVFANQLPVSTGRLIAINFYFERVNQYKTTDYSSIFIRESFSVGPEKSPYYYIFNIIPDGWVIVSAEDAVIPVLAYSFSGCYQPDNLPSAYIAWMKQYEDQIRYSRKHKNIHNSSLHNVWDHFLTTNHLSLIPFKNQREAQPLITSRWNQGIYYNELCPAVQGGPGGHAVAGCVPVCMGQIMYYYRWPKTGIGAYSFVDLQFGELSANFGNTTYSWNKMVNSVNRTNHSVAELLYHLGVSCDLVYGPDGSGMYNHKAAYSLRTYFKYSPQTQYLFRDSTNMNWDSVLVAHLDRKMPLYYAGWSEPNVIGHAFVCDGYQDTAYFHFNFGWGGSSDGYFFTDQLTPGGNIFNLAQEIIINCYPDTLNYTYPSYCNGETLLTSNAGSLDDGSGRMKNYLPNGNCTWLISPQNEEDSITDITVNFDLFETNPNDFVNLYDGPTTNDPLIGSFSGSVIPEPVTSSGNKLLITFNSNSGPSLPGWFATFTTNSAVWCTGTTVITSDTVLLTDGSLDFNYRNNSNCRWKLNTVNETPLTLYFRKFDTEPGNDVLRIYDLVSQDTLAEISGHYTPQNLPDSVTAPGGKMFLIFSTNSSVTAQGWEIYYPASHLSIEETGSVQSVKLFPNPAFSQIRLELLAKSSGNVEITLLNTQGVKCDDWKIATHNGINHVSLHLNDLPKGLYILKIQNDDTHITKKLIIN